MINLLDDTLENLIKASPSVPDYQMLHDASVSFDTPKITNTPSIDTVNLFLYETKENRELRDSTPWIESRNGVNIRRRAPLRLDCAYMVTAWSGAATDTEKSAHQLLGQALRWLIRFPTIPETYLPVTVPPNPAIKPQPFPPPTMVAQMDGAKSAGEFWHALGIPPRPYFNLVVTIAMSIGDEIDDGPPVVTKEFKFKQILGTANGGLVTSAAETIFEIAGTVRNAISQTAIADAEVTIVGTSQTSTTDADGQFRLSGLKAGTYTLRTSVNGVARNKPNVVVPATTLNAFDINWT